MCSVDWGLVIGLLAALGSCGAAIAALWIATRDRCERKTERLDAAKAQATLVLLDVGLSSGTPGFQVDIRNFGAEPILDVELDAAQFARVPDSTPKVVNRLGPTVKVIDADRQSDHIFVQFVDGKGDSVITTGFPDELGVLVIDNAAAEDLDVTIRFMDAHGNHWLRSLDSVKLDKRAKRH
jgi:hypothetical protein